MSTGLKPKHAATMLLLSSILLWAGIPALGTTPQARATHPAHVVRKSTKKKPDPPPPLPSGPTGRPVQQIPLDSIAAVAPQVTFENNQLTIVAPNSTLADILRAVRKQTGAEIEIPTAPERVVTHLGPGPAREIVAELLNGSRFNYVLLGSPADDTALTRIVLVAKNGPQDITPNAGQVPNQPAENQAANQPEPEQEPEGNEAEAVDDSANNNGDENAEQPAEAEQQQPPPDQNGVKTPQQMLQEMQQRQMQLQQQQPPGQPPIPGSGNPPHPPQEN